jgi:hypothetical protein
MWQAFEPGKNKTVLCTALHILDLGVGGRRLYILTYIQK